MKSNKTKAPEEEKQERIRFFMDIRGICFPVSGDDLYHFGCLTKDTFSKDIASGKNLNSWSKYSEKVEEICGRLRKVVLRATGSSPSHVLVFTAAPIGLKTNNIFKMKSPKFTDVWKLGTFGFIPILIGKTKSLERLHIFSNPQPVYAGFYKFGSGWMAMPCEDCLRYVHCMEKGIASFGSYDINDCPWFSADEPVPADQTIGVVDAMAKVKEENKNAVSAYLEEAVSLDDANSAYQ